MKHLVLTRALQALQRKPAALCFIDTHAGAGSYDLHSKEAEKIGEFRHGIELLWRQIKVPPPVLPYLDAVRVANATRGGALRFYPGSPALAHALLRPQDRMVLIERHPTDHARLARTFGREANCRVELGDGYALLKAFVPPREKRGLVLIDPAYELKHEYHAVVDCVAEAYRRWATGVYIVWYPLLSREQADKLRKRFVGTGIRRMLNVEFALTAPAAGSGMWGSGLVIVNPPFQLDQDIAATLPWLATQLGASPDAACGVHWLVPE